MGSSMKGGGNTTVTQDNEPPKWAAPLFQQSAKIAQDLYKSGSGFNLWPGSTTAAPSEASVLGSQGLQNVALSPDSYSLGQNPVHLTNQMLSQGGLMAPSQYAMNFLGNVAGGGMNPGTGLFYDAMNAAYNPATMQAANIYGQAGAGEYDTNTGGTYSGLGRRALGDNPAGEYYTGMARGDNLAEGNPYFREMLVKEADRLGDQVAGQFSAAGRYGSGANQDVLGETVGDFMLAGLGQDFDRERGYQMDAIRGLQDAHTTGIGQALAATQGRQGADAMNAGLAMQGAGGLGNIGQSLFANLLGGAQNIFGAEQQNLSNQIGAAQGASNISNQGLMSALGYINSLPTIQQNRTFAPQLLQQVGAQQDQANQAMLNDLISQFYAQDMQDWTRLGALQAAAQGSAGSYGQTHQVTNQPGTGLLGLLGGGLQLAAPFFGG